MLLTVVFLGLTSSYCRKWFHHSCSGLVQRPWPDSFAQSHVPVLLIPRLRHHFDRQERWVLRRYLCVPKIRLYLQMFPMMALLQFGGDWANFVG